MKNPLIQWLDGVIERRVDARLKATPRRISPSVILSGETPMSPDIVYGDGETIAETERLALVSAWAYSDIDEVASQFSRAAFSVERRTGEGTAEIPNHEFEMLLSMPTQAGFWPRAVLWKYLQYWLQLRGKAFWLLVPDGAGGLAEIWPIPSSRMRAIPDAQQYIRGYGYTPRHGQPEKFLPAETVCYFVNMVNPFDYHDGLSPLSAARLGLQTQFNAEKWNNDTFRNEATIRTVFSVDKDISEHDFNAVKADLQNDLQSMNLRYLITPAGELSVQTVGFNQVDLDYLGGMGMLRENIDRVFHIPGGYWDKDATQANAEAAKAKLADHIHDLHIMVQETITAQILRRWYGDDLVGIFEDVRPRDRLLESQVRKVSWQVVTVNEAREEIGKPPLDMEDKRGDMLVSELRGKLSQFGDDEEDEEEQDETGEEQESGGREVKADLKRWEKIARRLVREGESPGSYRFESDHIDLVTMSSIKMALADATTEEEVKVAFATGFPGAAHNLAWEQYG